VTTLRRLQAAAFVSSYDRFITPVLLLPIAADFAVSLVTISVAATLYYLLYGLMQPVWAVVSDRLGRIAVVRLALFVAAGAGLACGLAAGPDTVIAARAVSGAVLAGVIPASLVWVGEALPGDERRGTSSLMAGIYSGTLVASAAGAVAAYFDMWRAAVLASAAVSAVLAVALVRTTTPALASRPKVVDAVRGALTPAVALVVLLAVVEGGVVHGSLTYFPAALESLGTGYAVAGLSVGVFGIGVVVVSRWVQTSTWSRRRVMVVGGIALTAALALAAFEPGIPGLLVAVLLLGAGFAATHSPLQAWATSAAPEGRTIAVAFFVGGALAGAAAVTALGSASAEAGNFGVLFGTAAVAAAVFTLTLSRRT
jgi:MFS family permease